MTQLIMKKLSGVRPEVLYLGGYGRGARNFISPSLLLVHFHSYQILNASIWLSIFVGGGGYPKFSHRFCANRTGHPEGQWGGSIFNSPNFRGLFTGSCKIDITVLCAVLCATVE